MKSSVMRARVGRVACLVVAAAVAVGLAGCSPAIRGAIGLTVASDGLVQALLEPCEGLLTDATVYVAEGGGYVGDIAAEWSIAEDADASDNSPSGASLGLPTLDERQAYEIRAWADHPQEFWASTRQKRLNELEFSVAELRELPLGTVRWSSPTTSDVLDGTEDEFRKDACAEYTPDAD